MKKLIHIKGSLLVAAFGILLFSQCGQSAKQAADSRADEEGKTLIGEMIVDEETENQESEKVTRQDVNNEFKEAFRTASEHVDQQLDELAQNQAINRMERTAEKLDRKIIELEARLDERDLAKEARQEMHELKTLQNDLNDQLDEVKEATTDSWDELKRETKETYKESEKAIKQEVTKVERLLADNRN